MLIYHVKFLVLFHSLLLIYFYSSLKVVALVLVLLLVIFMLVGGFIFWKWKRIQEKKEKMWLADLERANEISDSIVQPFRPVS